MRAERGPRDAVAYIMDTFPIVKRKDEAAHGRLSLLLTGPE